MINFTFEEFKEKNNDKKIAVVYGNCHAMVVSEILSKDKDFLSKYAIYKIPPIQEIKDSFFFETECFRKCDVFIHQSVREDNKYGLKYSSSYITKKLKEDCLIIAIPNTFHMPKFLFPQCNYNKKTLQWRHGTTFFFRDDIIDNCLETGAGYKEAIDEYKNKELYSANEISERLELFKSKLKEREEDWDIKISDYVFQSFQTEKLFYDPSHPTNSYLNFIAKEIKTILLGDHLGNMLYDESVTKLGTVEMPVPFSVKTQLKITYDSTIIRNYSTSMKIRQKEMDIEEYVKQYSMLSWQNNKIAIRRRLLYLLWFLPYGLFGGIKRVITRVYKGVFG